MSDLISRQAAIDSIKKEWEEPLHSSETWEIIERTCDRIYNLPSAESNVCEETARGIATIIENEMDMRVILNNGDPDIVKVVRCKDCDRSQVDFDEHGEVTFRCRLYDPWIVYVGSDGLGFCSNGRKAD